MKKFFLLIAIIGLQIFSAPALHAKPNCHQSFRQLDWVRELLPYIQYKEPTPEVNPVSIQPQQESNTHPKTKLYSKSFMALTQKIKTSLRKGEVLSHADIMHDFDFQHDSIETVFHYLQRIESQLKNFLGDYLTQGSFESFLTPLTFVAILCIKQGIEFKILTHHSKLYGKEIGFPAILIESSGQHWLNELTGVIGASKSMAAIPMQVVYAPIYYLESTTATYIQSFNQAGAVGEIYLKSSFFKDILLGNTAFTHEFTHWMVDLAVYKQDIAPIWEASLKGFLPPVNSLYNNSYREYLNLSEIITYTVQSFLYRNKILTGQLDDDLHKKAQEYTKIPLMIISRLEKSGLILIKALKETVSEDDIIDDTDNNLKLFLGTKDDSIESVYLFDENHKRPINFYFNLPFFDKQRNSHPATDFRKKFIMQQLDLFYSSLVHIKDYFKLLDMIFTTDNPKASIQLYKEHLNDLNMALAKANLPIPADIFKKTEVE